MRDRSAMSVIMACTALMLSGCDDTGTTAAEDDGATPHDGGTADDVTGTDSETTAKSCTFGGEFSVCYESTAVDSSADCLEDTSFSQDACDRSEAIGVCNVSIDVEAPVAIIYGAISGYETAMQANWRLLCLAGGDSFVPVGLLEADVVSCDLQGACVETTDATILTEEFGCSVESDINAGYCSLEQAAAACPMILDDGTWIGVLSYDGVETLTGCVNELIEF